MLISQIADKEVANIVRDLHYRSPKSLQAMRKACEQCFILPDDCPYYDYSIFDAKKATRRLAQYPKQTHAQVVVELRKINPELAQHLSGNMELFRPVGVNLYRYVIFFYPFPQGDPADPKVFCCQGSVALVHGQGSLDFILLCLDPIFC